jgi:cysteine desulfurase
MRRPVYLDYNATQPLRPAARDAMLAVLAEPANASSIHRYGQAARRQVEAARAEVAQLIGADPGEITFTSGATEANATALRGIGCRTVLVSAIEHPSVREAVPGAGLVPVDRNGVVDLSMLDRMLADAEGPALVSLMLVNNETGVIQPVAEAAAIVHRHGGLIHSDATQAPGRIPVEVQVLGVDLLTTSSHKIGGPQGAGALYVRDGVAVAPLLRGGGQERRRRAGTENVAAIVGFGAAATELSPSLRAKRSNPEPLAPESLDCFASLAMTKKIAALRDHLEAQLRAIAPDLLIHGAGAPRVGNTSCFGAPGLSAETALIALDLAGIAVSSGAACSSGAVEPSRVLRAMGVPEAAAREAIRVSFGWATEPGDVARLMESWEMVYRRSRSATLSRPVMPIRELSG